MAKRKRRFGRTRRIGRKARRFRRGKDRRIPLIKTLAGVTPSIIAVKDSWEWNKANPAGMITDPVGQNGLITQLVFQNTGLYLPDGTFNTGILARNAALWVGGWIASKAVDYMGVNKAMKRIPVVGRIIKL